MVKIKYGSIQSEFECVEHYFWSANENCHDWHFRVQLFYVKLKHVDCNFPLKKNTFTKLLDADMNE